MIVATSLDFETLFRSQYPQLVAFGVAMTGDVETARDLAQETMARAHDHWTDVEATDVPEAWLRRVMRNLTVDHFRRTGTERRALDRFGGRAVGGSDAPVDSTMAELLAVLPERQRAVVALYYVDDLPTAEIAQTLSIAQGTVKALLWKARRTLARELAKETSDD